MFRCEGTEGSIYTSLEVTRFSPDHQMAARLSSDCQRHRPRDPGEKNPSIIEKYIYFSKIKIIFEKTKFGIRFNG